MSRTTGQQLHDLRTAVLDIATALGAALPNTPEVVASLNLLAGTPAPCKHCGLTIEKRPEKSASWLHADGQQQGRHTCAIEPYGFHAEPMGTSCGDHPANPCNGARGILPTDRR